jgi:hypothetical protein
MARLAEGELHLATLNKFGALEKGIVTVEGKVTTAITRYRPLPSELSYMDRFKCQEVKLVRDAKKAHMWQDSALDAVPDPVKLGDVVYCLPI